MAAEAEGVAIPITVTVNGTRYQSEVEPRLLLVHYLRDALGLTGTHVGVRYEPVRGLYSSF